MRYLENTFREVFKLKGTPLRLDFKVGYNPYTDKNLHRLLKLRPGASMAGTGVTARNMGKLTALMSSLSKQR
ncbi:hypothetical protein [Nitrosomonas sp.]|uniref:hypothetical protein n=1 Tax=Nitrosomonas sp. TaxID=42353 RepID=UPI0025E82147|nr:hypothetical protein [Nitrosomonas sp.]